MTKPDRKKNTKILTLLNTIEFLELLKTETLPDIAEHFDMTLRSAQYTKRKYNAYSDEQVDDAIERINRQIKKVTDYPPRDYEKQVRCRGEHGHIDATIFLKCRRCTLTLSENNIDEIIEILLLKKARLQQSNSIEIIL